MSELERGDVADNRYVVERLLGRGGMAAVYLVHHRTLGTHFALKVLELDRPSIRERLLKEGVVQSRMKHANIVSVTDAIEVGGRAALVMEYVHGPNLAQILDAGAEDEPALSLPQVDAVASALFDGLEVAHRLGIVHRDLKPHNVMMAVDGHAVVPKIADFGLVKILDDGGSAQTRTGTVFGTPEYMAPEQIRDAKTVDARADLFSLGAMLFELVSGTRPFASDSLVGTLTKVATGERAALRDVAPAAPERMITAVERALDLDRATRVQSVATSTSRERSRPTRTPTGTGLPTIPSTTSSRSTHWRTERYPRRDQRTGGSMDRNSKRGRHEVEAGVSNDALVLELAARIRIIVETTTTPPSTR